MALPPAVGLQEEVTGLGTEGIPNSALKTVDPLASQRSSGSSEVMAHLSMLMQEDEEPEVDTRCDVKMLNAIHLDKNQLWRSGADSLPAVSLKPRLTLSAFRKPASNMTQSDLSKTLEEYYDLNRPGCCGVLGHGAFSTVRLAVRKRDSLPVAVKSIAKHEALRSRRLRPGKHLEEWEILKEMKGSEFIIDLIDVFETDEEIQLCLEFCEGGELFNAIQRKRNRSHAMRRGQYSEEQAACITSQILRALNDLHSAGIVHRDVKPENILLLNSEDENIVRVKLADFNMARSLEPVSSGGTKSSEGDASPLTPGIPRSNSMIGSSYYMAPELTCSDYDTAVDIYSLGATLYVLLCGFPPVFSGSEGDQVSFPSLYWDSVSPEAKDLVEKMLNPVAANRITANEALRDVWIWKHRHSVTHALANSCSKDLATAGKINLELVRRSLSKSMERSRKRKNKKPSGMEASRSKEPGCALLFSPKRKRFTNHGNIHISSTNSSASSALMALADLYRDVAQSPSAKVISSVVIVETASDNGAFSRSPALPTLSF